MVQIAFLAWVGTKEKQTAEEWVQNLRDVTEASLDLLEHGVFPLMVHPEPEGVWFKGLRKLVGKCDFVVKVGEATQDVAGQVALAEAVLRNKPVYASVADWVTKQQEGKADA